MIHLTGTIYTGSGTATDAWIDGSTITYVRPTDQQAEQTLTGVFLPGLADGHCHIGLGAQGAVDADVARRQAAEAVASGVTLVRDLGVPQDMEWIDGEVSVPKIIHCGTHIARPKRYLRYFGREIEVHELPEVMAQEARASQGWVKLVGDWIDRSLGADADLTPLWPREVLIEGVAAAHENGAKVAVHTFATETIDDLLEAGVDDIEHGAGMTADHVKEAVSRGIIISPTANQTANFASFAEAGAKFPKYAATMMRLFERREEFMGLLADHDARILMGSDAGGTLDFGTLPSEVAACVDLGLPLEKAIAAASWVGRDILGYPSLVEGEAADLVQYASDPFSDVSVLSSPLAVLIDGKVSESTK